MIRKTLVSWILVAVSVTCSPPAADAKEKQTADIQVKNVSGREIEYVTVAHKYSDVYKHNKTWNSLPHGGVTLDSLAVEYNTGFGTTGIDWWLIVWKFKGDATIYRTNPPNLRGTLDDLEAVVAKVGGIMGQVGGTVVGGKTGGDIGAAIGTTLEVLLNSEKTAGFKQHILRPEDSRKKFARPTIIEIGALEVKILSPSGNSSTGAKVAKPMSPGLPR
jgi:Up-Regulated in long-lived daf-2